MAAKSDATPPESGDRPRLPFEPKAKSARAKDATAKDTPAKDSAEPRSVAAKGTAKGAAKSSGQADRNKAKNEKFEAIRQAARDARSGRKPGPAKVPTLSETRIPDVVGKRMLGRILLFSGIPTLVGILIFFISYYVVVKKIYEIPNVFVLLSSMLGFGLGVLGLSYGVLSSSWDEDRSGSALGFDEFAINSKRFIEAWKAFRSERRGKA